MADELTETGRLASTLTERERLRLEDAYRARETHADVEAFLRVRAVEWETRARLMARTDEVGRRAAAALSRLTRPPLVQYPVLTWFVHHAVPVETVMSAAGWEERAYYILFRKPQSEVANRLIAMRPVKRPSGLLDLAGMHVHLWREADGTVEFLRARLFEEYPLAPVQAQRLVVVGTEAW